MPHTVSYARIFKDVVPALLLASVWLIFFSLTDESWGGRLGVVSNVANLAALTAVVVACLAVTAALRPAILVREIGLPVLLELHKRLGIVVMGLVMIHGAGRSWIFAQTELGAVLDWRVNLGRVAALFLLTAGAAAYAGVGLRRLSREQWRPPHFLVYAALPMAFVHAFSLGEEITAWPLALLVGALGLFALSLMLRRLWTLARQGPAGT